VGPGAERAAFAIEHGDPRVVIGGERSKGGDQRLGGLPVHGVAHFRPGENHGRDRATFFDCNGHHSPPTSELSSASSGHENGDREGRRSIQALMAHAVKRRAGHLPKSTFGASREPGSALNASAGWKPMTLAKTTDGNRCREV